MSNDREDHRAEKRHWRLMGADDPVYDAWSLGAMLAEHGPAALPPRLRRNPYPPGRRHDAWQRGFEPHPRNGGRS